MHNANYKWLLQHDPNAPIHVKAQSLRNDLLEFAKNKIVGYRKDGRAIYMHQDVTSAVGVATRQDGVQELLASSSRGGRLLDEVANIIGNATWVSGGRRSAGSRKLLRHAEQRLFREVDNSDNYKGLENLYPTRKPCNGAGGCQSEIAARSNLGFGDFDSF